jgi:SAM-dependent methyltransferase
VTSPRELADYYRARAPEYDAIYAKPERQQDLARLRELLPPMVAGRRVLEVAAGTGYWTQVMSGTAAAIMATDLNAETLAVAAQRSYGSAQVQRQVADAYRLSAVPGEFDLLFCGFWWSHIARADVPRFVAAVRGRMPAGSRLIMMDNRYVPGSSHPIIRTGNDGDTFQRRRLRDGSSYEVLKNFPSRAQLTADLADAVTEVSVTELEYYWLAACRLR